MSDNPEIASLTRLIMEIQREQRDTATGNPLNKGSVRNAEGKYVAISSLAFGMVGAVNLAQVTIDAGTPGAPGGVGWYGWGPAVTVLVTGGKLRVDVAAALTAQGNKAALYVGYGLYGPSADESGAKALAAAAAYDRSVEAFDPGYAQGTGLAAGTFGLHTGLASGWYYVEMQYAMSFSGGIYTTGTASNRRLLATPY